MGKAKRTVSSLIFDIAAAAIGASLKTGSVIANLQSDLQKERELRGFEISKAYSDGRAFTLEQVLSEKSRTVELAVAEEYRNSREAKKQKDHT